MEMIAQINGTINGLVWGVPAMILIVGTGVYMTIGIGFKQFTRFGYVMKNTIGKAFTKHEVAEGAVTPFQALCTALAATVGTGNIVRRLQVNCKIPLITTNACLGVVAGRILLL